MSHTEYYVESMFYPKRNRRAATKLLMRLEALVKHAGYQTPWVDQSIEWIPEAKGYRLTVKGNRWVQC